MLSRRKTVRRARTGFQSHALESRCLLSAGDTLWTHQFGSSADDSAHGAANANQSVYVVGSTEGNLAGQNVGDWDAFVHKVDAAGNTAWTRQFGTSGEDDLTGSAVAADGSVYVGGYVYGLVGETYSGTSDAIVRHYRADGTVAWTQQFGTPSSDFISSVAVDGNGDVYVCGGTDGSLSGVSAGGRDIVVAKFSATGQTLWTRQYGTPSYDDAYDLAVDSQGNVYVAGSSGDYPTNADAVLYRLKPNGDVVWIRTVGSAAQDEAESVVVDPSDNVYLYGDTLGAIEGKQLGGSDLFIRKYSPAGATIWTQQFGTPEDDGPRGAAIDPSGGLYVCGQTYGTLDGVSSGGRDGFIRRLSFDGAHQWTRQFGNGETARVVEVCVDDDGNPYAVGKSDGGLPGVSPFAGGDDGFVRKFDGGASAPVGTADLAVTGVGGVKAGNFVAGTGKAKVKVRLTNNAAEKLTGQFETAAYLSADGTLDKSDVQFAAASRKLNLKPGKSKNVSIKGFYPTGLPDGTYYVLAKADSANALVESDEANNVNHSDTPVGLAAPFADLAIESIEVPSAAAIGRPVSARVRLTNLGNVTAEGSSDLSLYASLDKVFGNADDVLLDEMPLTGKIKPGASKTITVKFTPDGDAGTYFVGARVLPVLTVGGDRIDNNTKFSDTQITVA